MSTKNIALFKLDGASFSLARQLRIAFPIIAALLALPGQAMTTIEETIKKAPMPHKLLGTGATVKVHFASMEGYHEGKPDNHTRVMQLKAHVQECVQQGPLGGGPAKPPQVWPDFILSLRTDDYSTANRSIHYASSVSYAVNWADCSLLEVQSHTAELASSQGTCKINLLKKTAHGQCDTTAHAGARPPIQVAPSSMAEVIAAEKRSANNPGLRALLDAMKKNSNHGTGERKAILGIDCEFWQSPLDASEKICLSLGGSFAAINANGEQHSSMALAQTSQYGIKMQATEAKLDTMVNAAIFAPYLAGGFKITQAGTRK